MSQFRVDYLPFLVVAIVVVTTSITFYLSYFYYEHVTYLLPYISDTGTYPPESCIFGQSLNIVAFLLLFALYVKYRQVHEMYLKHHIEEKYNLNNLTLYAGCLTCLGISLVANFQETNQMFVHWSGAILVFGGGSIYACLQTMIYIKISPVIGQRKTTMFRILLSLISLISFFVFVITAFKSLSEFNGDDVTKWSEKDGGFSTHLISTYAEWITASATLIYVLLFYPEFRKIGVGPLIVTLEEQKLTHNDVTIKY